MGSYTAFEYEDIKVTDPEGLFDYLMKIKEDDNYGDYMYDSFLNNLIDGKQYSFEDWDNTKLISYWYKEQVEFLDKISKYIEGYVCFSFETPDEVAKIRFENGKTIFELGEMKYTEHTAKDFGINERLWK